VASLVTPADVKRTVRSALEDADLQLVIDQEEAEVVRLFGAHYIDAAQTIVETLPGGKRNLWLRRRITAVTAVVEDTMTLTSGEYRVWGEQGRVNRLYGVTAWLAGDEDDTTRHDWGQVVVITYKPADDNALRKPVIVELVRLALERTTMDSENVAGEYSYSAPNWEAKRGDILRRLALARS
jgi:hypothetical protein